MFNLRCKKNIIYEYCFTFNPLKKYEVKFSSNVALWKKNKSLCAKIILTFLPFQLKSLKCEHLVGLKRELRFFILRSIHTMWFKFFCKVKFDRKIRRRKSVYAIDRAIKSIYTWKYWKITVYYRTGVGRKQREN